jgi:hypothetical protein
MDQALVRAYVRKEASPTPAGARSIGLLVRCSTSLCVYVAVMLLARVPLASPHAPLGLAPGRRIERGYAPCLGPLNLGIIDQVPTGSCTRWVNTILGDGMRGRGVRINRGFGIVMEGLRLRGGAPRLRKRKAQDDWDEDEGPEQDEDNDLDGQRGEDDEIVRSDEGIQKAVGSDEEQGKVHENEDDTDSDTSSGRTLRWDKILESMEPVRPRPVRRAQQARALTASRLSGAGCRFRRTIAKRSARLNGAATSQTGGPQMMTSVPRTPRWAPVPLRAPARRPIARRPNCRRSCSPSDRPSCPASGTGPAQGGTAAPPHARPREPAGAGAWL